MLFRGREFLSVPAMKKTLKVSIHLNSTHVKAFLDAGLASSFILRDNFQGDNKSIHKLGQIKIFVQIKNSHRDNFCL